MNLIGTGNVFQLAYDDICELCRRYSRGNFKTGKNSKELLSPFLKSAAKTRVLQAEINNLFKISKADSQSVVLQDKEKQEEIREARDFPLDNLESCGICDLNHSTDHCPSLPKMKETYHRDMGVASNSLQQSCQPWPTSMIQNSIPPFPYSHTQSLNTLPPWQLLQTQFNSYLP